VILYRAHAQAEVLGDFRIRQPTCDLIGDLPLAGGELRQLRFVRVP
jgi:hypothetical protein